jgi:hypothetical protein
VAKKKMAPLNEMRAQLELSYRSSPRRVMMVLQMTEMGYRFSFISILEEEKLPLHWMAHLCGLLLL